MVIEARELQTSANKANYSLAELVFMLTIMDCTQNTVKAIITMLVPDIRAFFVFFITITTVHSIQ